MFGLRSWPTLLWTDELSIAEAYVYCSTALQPESER
jgi:hypothetical protein